MSWLDDLLEQHKELESPTSFWKWSALAAVSAILRDNVWFDKQAYNVYPNIYVMLHAESGLRKGPPISMAKQLVTIVDNTKIISGRSSIQGILKELGTARSLPGGKVEAVNSAFICASELGSSLVDDIAVIKILTDLYDRNYNQGDWNSLLKSEKFSIRNPVISMLTGTNESMGEDFLTNTAIKGGLVARTAIINETNRQTINSLMFPLKTKIDYNKSAEYLKTLAMLRGPLEMDDVDRHYFDDWYIDFMSNRDKAEIKDTTGTLNRFDDSVIKVAMILSLLDEPVLKISRKALEQAIASCQFLIGSVRKTTLGAGKSQYATEKAMLIKLLAEREGHSISQQMLNKAFWTMASEAEWNDITKQLAVAGIIQVENRGSQVVYVMPDKIVVEMKKHFGGK